VVVRQVGEALGVSLRLGPLRDSLIDMRREGLDFCFSSEILFPRTFIDPSHGSGGLGVLLCFCASVASFLPPQPPHDNREPDVCCVATRWFPPLLLLPPPPLHSLIFFVVR